jgi:hypothetical protein
MNNYIIINNNETIGDSLSSVNLNYLNLELDTLSVMTSSTNYWSKLYDYCTTFSYFIKSASDFFNQISPYISNAASLVERNSSNWIKPITIFYPSLFPSNSSNVEIQNVLLNWIQTTFPVFPTQELLFTDLNTGNTEYIKKQSPAYLEGQKLIVYAYTWTSTPEVVSIQNLQDYTQCETETKSAYLECSSRWYGGTYCGTGTWADCGGAQTTCNKEVNVTCEYNSPPYEDFYSVSNSFKYKKTTINTKQNYAKSYIRATVETYHVDRYEDSIQALVFTIQNCNWVYERNIS